MENISTGAQGVAVALEPSEADALDAVRVLLRYIGEDPTREGLADTPRRFLKMLRERTAPVVFNPTTFAGEAYDEMIVQDGIPFYSLCEHHMLPFFGTATVAYIPRDRIVGLSKLARLVDAQANALQNQERITTQIADRLSEFTGSQDVAVVLRARHMCMEMRGVKKPGTHTTTSRLRGVFRSESTARAELMALIK